jgi:predicted  nucleic acid-binding Zn-ribbon protein
MSGDREFFRHYKGGKELLADVDHLQFEKLEWEDRCGCLEDELAQTEQWLEGRAKEFVALERKYTRLKRDFEEKVKEQNNNLYYKASKYADIILEMDKIVSLANVRMEFAPGKMNNLNQLRKDGGLPPL